MSGESSTGRASEAYFFRSRLDNILGARLTAENIDSYAEDALTSVIGLVDQTLTAYREVSTQDHETSYDEETAAFEHFGLTDVGVVLDHIQGVASEITNIDQLITETPAEQRIHVPPDQTSPNITPGSGEFDEKRRIPRLKTVLFILSQDFDVDVHNPEQVQISPGTVGEGMMRRLGYTLVDVPALNRSVLVCDEEGNATFIFNNEVMAEIGQSPELIAELTKSQIRELLLANPYMGKRLIYDSEYFVPGIRDAITRPVYIEGLNASENTENASDDRYLYPAMPEGYNWNYGLAGVFGIPSYVVDEAVASLSAELGDVLTARYGVNITQAFSPEQQERIRQHLETQGMLDRPPEGSLTARRIAIRNDLTPSTVQRIIDEHRVELGEIFTYNWGEHEEALTPGQQGYILHILDEYGHMREVPEGYLTRIEVAHELGLASSALNRVLRKIHPSTLEPEYRARIEDELTTVYSPEQVAVIIEAHNIRG